jgi:hypothetical protein
MSDYPALSHRRHWQRLGRDHGRRAVPTDAGGPYPAADDLRSALTQEVLDARHEGAAEVAPVDARRAKLRGERKNKQPPAKGLRSLADADARSRAALDGDLAAQDAIRAGLDAALVGEIQQLMEAGARAAAAYTDAFHKRSRLKIELAPIDLTLPDELTGPIPDPLGTTTS